MSRLARRKGEKGYVFPLRSTLRKLTLLPGLNFEEISKQIGKPEVWTAALFYGQAKVLPIPPCSNMTLTRLEARRSDPRQAR